MYTMFMFTIASVMMAVTAAPITDGVYYDCSEY